MSLNSVQYSPESRTFVILINMGVQILTLVAYLVATTRADLVPSDIYNVGDPTLKICTSKYLKRNGKIMMKLSNHLKWQQPKSIFQISI